LMLGELWSRGIEIDWAALHGPEGGQQGRRRVPLPGYPFQRKPCWVLPRLGLPAAGSADQDDAGIAGESDRRLDPGYQLRLYREADAESADL
jgi:acyl transferase domain-containing protein